MVELQSATGHLQELLDALRAGDDSARDALLQHSLDRFRELARRMFRRQKDLRKIDETDDVLQKAMMRLYRALDLVKPPDVRAFCGLAARQIRWVLGDLARETAAAKGMTYAGSVPDVQDPLSEPSDLLEWTAFHDRIEALPEEDREMFDLLLYQGVTQDEAAAILKTSLRTVKRRWQKARLVLDRALTGEWPQV